MIDPKNLKGKKERHYWMKRKKELNREIKELEYSEGRIKDIENIKRMIAEIESKYKHNQWLMLTKIKRNKNNSGISKQAVREIGRTEFINRDFLNEFIAPNSYIITEFGLNLNGPGFRTIRGPFLLFKVSLDLENGFKVVKEYNGSDWEWDKYPNRVYKIKM